MDGKIASWSWDLGDGTKARAARRPRLHGAWHLPRRRSPCATTPGWPTARPRAPRGSSSTTRRWPTPGLTGPRRSASSSTFDGTGSVDRDGKLVRHEWDFGDGAAGAGSQRPVRLRPAGHLSGDADRHRRFRQLHEHRDRSADGHGQRAPGRARRRGSDRDLERGPVRRAGLRGPRRRRSRATLWDFGDGTTGEGVTPTHVYRKPGEYRVRLTVTDNSGTARSSADRHASACWSTRRRSRTPAATSSGRPGRSSTFSGSGSLDPDGDIASYAWDFRDGTTASGRAGYASLRAARHLRGPADRPRRYRPTRRRRLRRGRGGHQRAAGRQRRRRRAGGRRRRRRAGRRQLLRPRTARSRATAGTSATQPSRLPSAW